MESFDLLISADENIESERPRPRSTAILLKLYQRWKKAVVEAEEKIGHRKLAIWNQLDCIYSIDRKREEKKKKRKENENEGEGDEHEKGKAVKQAGEEEEEEEEGEGEEEVEEEEEEGMLSCSSSSLYRMMQRTNSC